MSRSTRRPVATRAAAPAAVLTIGEVARRTGLAASALRYYEREGLLPRASRHGGRRVWSADVLGRLSLISVAKAAGFSVSEIRTLLSGFGRRVPPSQRWRALARVKRAELNARIAEAERMKAVLDRATRCACPTLDACGAEIAAAAKRSIR